MPIKLLHTNDLHGKLDDRIETFIANHRTEADFYFDTGDAIKAGNLGIPLQEEEVWSRLDRLNCTASVIGNRETHILAGAMKAKLAGATHPILCANLRTRDGTRPLPGTLELESNGLKIAVFGVSVAMVTEKMRTQLASAYLWDQPLETARELVEQLRPKADLLIALTHIGHRNDITLAETDFGPGGGIDIILGGHSHTVLQEPQLVNQTWIAQGGSHGRFLGKYQWDGKTLTGSLIPIP